MRTYSPIRIGVFSDPGAQKEIHKTNIYLRQLSTQIGRIPAAPQGTPSQNGGGGGAVDLTEYLFLPGRTTGQQSRQRVTFEAKTISAGGITAIPSQYGVGFTAYTNSVGERPTVNISIEETAAGRTSVQNREWMFPAFNTNSSGQTSGTHFFVDTSDYQVITKKLLNNGNYIAIEDTTIPSGFFNAAWSKALMVAWGGGYPAGGFNFAAGTLSTPTGDHPSVQIPALDYKGDGTGQRDRTHVLPVVKRAHTFASSAGAPFEPSGLLFGSSSGRELYPMFTTAQGTLAAPTDGSFPLWHPAVTQSCTFTLSSAVVTMASTTGIIKGMRMRETMNNYALSEDTHVLSVDSPTQITMSQVWPASNLVRTVDFFGMTWSDTATSITLGAGALTDYLYLPGRATGQRIGSATQTGNSDDIAISGRVTIGTGALISDQLLTLTGTLNNVLSTRSLFSLSATVAASGAIGVSQYRGLSATLIGGSGITSAGGSFQGGNFLAAPTMAAGGFAATEVIGLRMAASPVINGTTTIGTVKGFEGAARGGGAYLGNVVNIDNIYGMDGIVTTKNYYATDMAGVHVAMDSSNPQRGVALHAYGAELNDFGLSGQFGSTSTAATVATGSNVVTNVAAISNIVVGMYLTGTGIPAATFVTGVNVGLSQFTMNNNATANAASITYAGGIVDLYLVGHGNTGGLADNVQRWWGVYFGASITPHVLAAPVRLGDTTRPTHRLEIAAGSASIAPILLTSGTVLTTAAAGAIEFNTDDFFATITTGAARKAFVLDDGTRLTSGRVPFATTNGRLIDNAAFLFAAGTGLTLSALNLITDTTTGMKVGTAANQKLGFWNTAPVVQPTTAGAAATFVANTSGIVDDSATFDGYTIGQVVKALRTIGVLA